MGYIVRFDSLDALNNKVYTQTQTWAQELEQIKGKVQTLIETSNMSGEASDNIRAYFENIHMTALGLISQLLSLHSSNCLIYKSDYQSKIDTNLHAVLRHDEIDDYHTRLTNRKKAAVGIDEALAPIVTAINNADGINDIWYSDITSTANQYDSVLNFLSNLDEQIENLENDHFNKDFANAQQMIQSLTAFLREQTGTSRSYKTDFSMEALASSATFADLYAAYVEVNKECQEKANALDEAIQNENDRVAALAEEERKAQEEREKKAKVFKWIVTGVCIVGSIAATVVTAGAASGVAAVVIAGAISGASSALVAGANNLADQYTLYGYDHSKYDWNSFGEDVLVAGVTGFVTGAVGAGLGGGVTSALSKSTVGSTLLQSNNALVRIGTGAVIGSVSEVSSGVVSRGASTLLTTGDIEKSAKAAFDGGEMIGDAVGGAVGGAVDNIHSNSIKQKHADQRAADYNAKHNPMEDAEKAGIKNIKQTKNGGLDFHDTDAILRTESGDVVEVKIKATGNRQKDYEQAERIMKEQGVDLDLKKMRTQKKNGYVWHHMDDYNAATNETTMQFIKKDAHAAIKNHSGSAAQYHAVHGNGYKKVEFDPYTKMEKYDPSQAVGAIKDRGHDTYNSIQDMSARKDASPATYSSVGYDGASLDERMANILKHAR